MSIDERTSETRVSVLNMLAGNPSAKANGSSFAASPRANIASRTAESAQEPA